ncbi:hypothetical protein BH10PSE7_BH10PSE7_40570 [soil metagenome]
MKIVMVLATLVLLSQAARAEEDDGVTLLENCQWRDQTVLINAKPNQQLSFRWQACSGTEEASVTFALDKDNVLQQSWDGASTPVAKFWPLGGDKPSQAVEKIARPLAPADEKDRCVVRLDYVDHTYHFEPDAAFMEELLARDEPFSACGDYGDTNDAIQYFAVIDTVLLAFVWAGQDTPLFDPASFKYVNTEKPGVVE